MNPESFSKKVLNQESLWGPRRVTVKCLVEYSFDLSVSYNGNKVDKSYGYSTRHFTVVSRGSVTLTNVKFCARLNLFLHELRGP